MPCPITRACARLTAASISLRAAYASVMALCAPAQCGRRINKCDFHFRRVHQQVLTRYWADGVKVEARLIQT
jgi:hypothetical protein